MNGSLRASEFCGSDYFWTLSCGYPWNVVPGEKVLSCQPLGGNTSSSIIDVRDGKWAWIIMKSFWDLPLKGAASTSPWAILTPTADPPNQNLHFSVIPTWLWGPSRLRSIALSLFKQARTICGVGLESHLPSVMSWIVAPQNSYVES